MKKVIEVVVDKSANCNSLLNRKSAYIRFDFDMDIVNYIKALRYRYYDPDTKIWEIQYCDLKAFCLNFGPKGYKINIKDIYKEVDPNKGAKIQIPSSYDFGELKPLEHQKEGIIFGLNHDKFLLGDEMGVGKTYQSLHITNINCQKGKVLVIVCSATLKYNWQMEIQKTLGLPSHILGTITKYKKDGSIKSQHEGNGQDKLNDLINIDNIKEKYIITNRETLYLLKEKVGRSYKYPIAEQIERLCQEGKIEGILVDEFHLGLKDVSTNGAKALLKIKSAKVKIAMTGTPILNNPLEIFVVLQWLNILSENMNFWIFKNTFADLDNWGKPKAYKNLPQLSELLRTHMLRRLKSEVLQNLPDKVYKDEYIEMSAPQKRLYHIINAGLQDDMHTMIFSTEPVSRTIELRKVTGNPKLIDASLKDEDNAKLQRLKELVKEIVDNGHKVVIFSQWTNNGTELLKEHLKQYNPAYITGEVAQEDRIKETNKLQNDPNCKVLIGNTAMGTGLTMTAADYLIFYDELWTDGGCQQIEDRIHRIGQTNKATIIRLMCKNTIDEGVDQIVHKKGELARYLVNGEIDKTSHKNLIQALLSFNP